MSNDVRRRNNVQVSGSGERPLLFAHGFGCDRSIWRHVRPSFETRWRTVAYDLTGLGNSDLGAWDRERYATLDGHALDMIEICEALELPPVTVIAHSVSAMIAVLAANRRPELFERLVLVAPSPCYRNAGDYRGGFDAAELRELFEFMDANYLGWSDYLARVATGEGTDGATDRSADRSTGSELTSSLCRTDPVIARQLARITFLSDHREDVRRLVHPALVLQCSDDDIVPVHVDEWLAEHMPDATLRVLRTVGHVPHASAPAETARAIATWIE